MPDIRISWSSNGREVESYTQSVEGAGHASDLLTLLARHLDKILDEQSRTQMTKTGMM